MPGLPLNWYCEGPCDVTVVISESGRVIPALDGCPSSVFTQFAGEPGWFPAVKRYGM